MSATQPLSFTQVFPVFDLEPTWAIIIPHGPRPMAMVESQTDDRRSLPPPGPRIDPWNPALMPLWKVSKGVNLITALKTSRDMSTRRREVQQLGVSCLPMAQFHCAQSTSLS